MIFKTQSRGSAMSFGKSVDAFIRDTQKDVELLDNETEKIVRKTADRLVTESVKRTPVDTGKAKRSWATSQMLNRNNKGRNTKIYVFNTARVAKDNRSGHYYIRFVNDGTIMISPRRFFEKAIAVTSKYQMRELNKLMRRLGK